MLDASSQLDRLAAPVLGLALLALLFAFILWRRDRSLRPGGVPVFSALAGVRAGMRVTSYPLERVEVWPDALFVAGFSLVIPWEKVRSVSLQHRLGVTNLVLEYKQPWRSRLRISVKEPGLLLSAIASVAPRGVIALPAPEEKPPA